VPNYRRAFVPGGCFFFTLVTAKRRPILCTDLGRSSLRRAIQSARARWPFRMNAIVLLPEHLHSIWTLPPGDTDYSRRWGWIKREFTIAWLAEGGSETHVSGSQGEGRRRGVWQRRFWEHDIRDEHDFANHCDYIHYNPVKHGHVQCPRDWPHSTFVRFVEAGDYGPDWGCSDQPPPKFEVLDRTAME